MVRAGGAEPVSAREAQVLAAVGAHLSNAQIAHRLSISVRTVESHVSALLRKLGARDRRELAELGHLADANPPAPQQVRGLPTVHTSFVGRSAERAQVLAALAESRLVALVGPGGVGKTRLALETVGGRGRGGAFIDLVPVQPGLVAQAVARVLGVVERPSHSLEGAIAERLGRTPSLLVLDNCEHLLGDVTAFVAGLSADCPDLWTLLTTRERPGLACRVVPVAPLSLTNGSDGAGGADGRDGSGGSGGADSSGGSDGSGASDGSVRSEAERLFMDRAEAAGADPAENPDLIRLLCARLDGMPLAIELAAARMPSMGPGGLLAALDDHLRALTGGRSADSRHHSLRAVLDWSHDLLDPDERDLFRRLAVFAGGFDLPAAAALAPHLPLAAIADLLGRLADKSLLVRERSRWRMLETVHAYALDRLAASPGEVRSLHRAWARRRAAELTARVADSSAEQIDPGVWPGTGQSPARQDDVNAWPGIGQSPTWQDDVNARPGTGQSPTWQDDFDAVVDDLRRVADDGDDVVACDLAGLLYARRFLTEAMFRYEQAGAFRDAADAAFAGARGDLAFELLIKAATAARQAGDAHGHSTSLAYAVTVAGRAPAMFPRLVTRERLDAYLAEARSAAPPGDALAAAYLAAAEAWARPPDQFSVDAGLARTALAEAERAGDLALISAALDAMSSAAAHDGHFREAYRLGRRRGGLLAAMPRHDPRFGLEIFDIAYMMVELAVDAGDLHGALAAAQRAREDDIAGDLTHSAASKPLIPLVLMGRFDEALGLAEQMWQGWLRAGAPAAAWLSASAYSLTLPHGLRDNPAGVKLWRERALRITTAARGGADRRLTSFMTFADARIALHTNDFSRLDELLSAVDPRAFAGPYAAAATAELAVAAGRRPDLGPAREAAAENDWAAACYARIRARLGERAALGEALDRWEALGASVEADYTRQLAED